MKFAQKTAVISKQGEFKEECSVREVILKNQKSELVQEWIPQRLHVSLILNLSQSKLYVPYYFWSDR